MIDRDARKWAVSENPVLWYNNGMENNDIQSVCEHIIDIKNIIHATCNKTWSAVNAVWNDQRRFIGAVVEKNVAEFAQNTDCTSLPNPDETLKSSRRPLKAADYVAER